jgi:hypothetical protein
MLSRNPAFDFRLGADVRRHRGFQLGFYRGKIAGENTATECQQQDKDRSAHINSPKNISKQYDTGTQQGSGCNDAGYPANDGDSGCGPEFPDRVGVKRA